MKNELLSKKITICLIISLSFLLTNNVFAIWGYTPDISNPGYSCYAPTPTDNCYIFTEAGADDFSYNSYGSGGYSVSAFVYANSTFHLWSEYENYSDYDYIDEDALAGIQYDYTWYGTPGSAPGADISMDISASSSTRHTYTWSEISDDTTGYAYASGAPYFYAYCTASQTYDEEEVSGYLWSAVETDEDAYLRLSFYNSPDSYYLYTAPNNDDLYQFASLEWSFSTTDLDYEIQSAVPEFSVYSYADIYCYCENEISANSSEISDAYSEQSCGIDFSSTCTVSLN